MKRLFSIAKKKKRTPKERVRALMEAGSGYQWTKKHEADDALEYASTTSKTPGLCIFANGECTLSPETRLAYFDFSKGDFSFDDAPEARAVFNGSSHAGAALRSELKAFLWNWLKAANWGAPDERAADQHVTWTFKHADARPPPLALGGISFENLPEGSQLNIEFLRAADAADAPSKFKLCISFIDHS